MCETHYRRVKKTGSPDLLLTPTLTRYEVDLVSQCWLYTGPLYDNGYGKLSRSEHGTRLAHRASFMEHRPEIDISALTLDHMCRTVRCMNPWHLDPVTQSENIRRGYDVRNQGMCRNGLHTMSEANVYTDARGFRVCKVCKNAKDRRSGQRYRERLRSTGGE